MSATDDLISARLSKAIKGAGVPIVSVSIGDATIRSIWTVHPASLQGAAQSIIDAFNPTDPAHEIAELDAAVTAAMDTERLISAVVWMVIDTYSAPATITKYNVARTKIIAVYKSQPWKP